MFTDKGKLLFAAGCRQQKLAVRAKWVGKA
jgi:hypothetical protein